MIFVKMGQFKSLRETEKGQKRIARSILLAHKVLKGTERSVYKALCLNIG